MKTLPIFSTLVGIQKQFISTSVAKDIQNFILEDVQNHRTHPSLTNKSVSSHQLKVDLLEKLEMNISSCKDIKKNIDVVVKHFCQIYGYFHDGLSNSWYNIQDVGSTLKNHTHPMSVVSGALYINVDNESSTLNFLNPNLHMKYNITTQFKTEFNNGIFTIVPEIGDLIIFPSWLEHGSHGEVNNTKDRIVISFNVSPIKNNRR